jgi:hypothetical protein
LIWRHDLARHSIRYHRKTSSPAGLAPSEKGLVLR